MGSTSAIPAPTAIPAPDRERATFWSPLVRDVHSNKMR